MLLDSNFQWFNLTNEAIGHKIFVFPPLRTRWLMLFCFLLLIFAFCSQLILPGMFLNRWLLHCFLMVSLVVLSSAGTKQHNDSSELNALLAKIADAVEEKSSDAIVLIGELHNLPEIDKNLIFGLDAYYRGEIAYYEEVWPQAISFYQTSLEYFNLSGDSAKMASAWNNLGLVYYYQASYDKALDAYSHSMEMEMALKNNIGIAKSYHNMALVLMEGGHNQRALEFLFQALTLFESEEEWGEVASVYNNLAIHFAWEKEYQKAAHYYERSIDIYKRLGMEENEAILLGNIGALLTKEGDYDRSAKLLERALFLMKSRRNNRGEANIYSLLGDLYMARGEHQQAVYLYKKADDHAKVYNLNDIRLQNLLSLCNAYKEISAWQNALTTYEQYVELKDLIWLENPEHRKGILNYELEQKLNERDLMIYKAGLKQKYLMGLLLVLGFSFLVGSFLVWMRCRKFKQAIEVEDMQKQLIKERVNPVFISSLLDSLRESLQKGNVIDANAHLSGVSDLIRKMIEHSCQELIPLSKEIEFLETYFAVQKQRFNREVTYQIFTNIQSNTDQVLVPSMLTQPFLEHSFAGIDLNEEGHSASFKIAFMRRDNYLDVIIENKGKGMGDFNNEELEKRHRTVGATVTRTLPRIKWRKLDHPVNMFMTEQTDVTGRDESARVKFSLPLMIN
jgi:tetratricopeptide (TPR) repeat protein